MKISVAGCAGRMGREVIKAVLAQPEHQLVGGCVAQGDKHAGIDLGLLAGQEIIGVAAVEDLAAALSPAEVMIDFSRPSLTLTLAALAAASGKILVTGTTGFTPDQQAELAELAKRAVILQSFNMSLGVNLLAALVERTASLLDSSFDIEILEMHHRHKVDAPSGTALLLGNAAAAGRKVSLPAVEKRSRDGITGKRPEGEIGFAVLRGGDVVGDHHIIFAGAGERLTLSHQSSSRGIYAQGALKAASWLMGKPAGRLYSMQDVLGMAV
jgi:4-hydroxy-tetrahydrodipicolinate reductase